MGGHHIDTSSLVLNERSYPAGEAWPRLCSVELLSRACGVQMHLTPLGVQCSATGERWRRKKVQVLKKCRWRGAGGRKKGVNVSNRSGDLERFRFRRGIRWSNRVIGSLLRNFSRRSQFNRKGHREKRHTGCVGEEPKSHSREKTTHQDSDASTTPCEGESR